jgi:hypothetical protein
MSPNEAQLRVALHEGEGDGVDADGILAHVAERRRHRRRLAGSVAGSVAVVAAVGVGAAVVAGGNGSNVSASGADSAASGLTSAGSAAQPHSLPTSTSTQPFQVTVPPGFALPQCPSVPPNLPTVRSGQPGANGPLFARPIASLTVCGYSGARSAVQSTHVTGSTATDVANQLERASANGARDCPLHGLAAELAILPTASDGTKLPTVVVIFSCTSEHNTTATNGTAVRYGWAPPPWVLRLVGGSAPIPGVSNPASGVNGSPPSR